MWAMTSRCHSCEPWHMLRRATFMPLAASVASASLEQDAGPMVQISLVRLVLRGPARQQRTVCWAQRQHMDALPCGSGLEDPRVCTLS
jgi:hypothetical protein